MTLSREEKSGIVQTTAERVITEECDWYLAPKADSRLMKYLNERIPFNAESNWCSEDEQNISIDYIRCVKLDDIEPKHPWSPERLKKIEQWATPDKLRTLKFYQDEQGKPVISNASDLPALTREVDLDNPTAKYEIYNGIHRIAQARKLGMDCILAYVSETIKVKKGDIDEYIALH